MNSIQDVLSVVNNSKPGVVHAGCVLAGLIDTPSIGSADTRENKARKEYCPAIMDGFRDSVDDLHLGIVYPKNHLDHGWVKCKAILATDVYLKTGVLFQMEIDMKYGGVGVWKAHPSDAVKLYKSLYEFFLWNCGILR